MINQRPWCVCDPEYDGRCPYPCQIDPDELNAIYSWTFACGHTIVGGNECADACPECGEPDLRRKSPAVTIRIKPVRELLIALALVRSGPRVAALLRERLDAY